MAVTFLFIFIFIIYIKYASILCNYILKFYFFIIEIMLYIYIYKTIFSIFISLKNVVFYLQKLEIVFKTKYPDSKFKESMIKIKIIKYNHV